MKYAVIAALCASVAQAADDAAAKVCAKEAVKVEAFSDGACATAQADAAKTKAVVGDVNVLIAAANMKCAAVPASPVWADATFYKVTCDGTTIKFAYFSDDKCATTKAPTANAYADIKTVACGTKAWDGTTALAGDVQSLKLTVAALSDGSGATFVKAMGAAATLAVVASSLY
jgi:hypothetical protein